MGNKSSHNGHGESHFQGAPKESDAEASLKVDSETDANAAEEDLILSDSKDSLIAECNAIMLGHVPKSTCRPKKAMKKDERILKKNAHPHWADLKDGEMKEEDAMFETTEEELSDIEALDIPFHGDK